MTGGQAPLKGPMAWEADELEPSSWRIDCTERDIKGLTGLVEDLDRRSVSLESATAEDFGAEAMRGLADRVVSCLNDGPGFALVRTWPVDDWGVDATGTLFWGLGSLVGVPLPQNDKADRLSAVRRQAATGAVLSESARRGSHSDQEIDFHTENARPPQPPRVIALLCCSPAAEGGESALVSGHAVHNRLLREYPGAVEALSESFLFARPASAGSDGQTTDRQAVFTAGPSGTQVRFNRYWMERGAETGGQPWSERSRDAVDAFEAVAHQPGMSFVHRLSAGEMVFVNNRVVLHSRRGFVDHLDQGPGRMLWRLWCS